MGLFDKKFCDVCGNKIGLLGNKKLEDGNLCKDCASKLSPWFTGRRHTTLEDIKAQLAYREENRQAVSAFHTTRSLGKYTKVLLDEDARKFMVTSARNLSEANPDVLDYAQVTGCDLDIDEDRSELKREDKDGKSVSYVPPRYEYSYSFYITIRVNHPYFDEIRFSLSNGSIDAGQRPVNAARPTMAPADYVECLNLGNEIKQILTNAREEIRSEVAAQNAPRTPVTCPCCGANTLPDANGCCEYCGSPLRG